MVLWDLGLVIRFPSATSIMLPSALLRHSNVPIASGEKRMSLVQYTSGGLFRWVENGMKSDAEIVPLMTAKERKDWEDKRRQRWAKHLDLFSLLSELVQE